MSGRYLLDTNADVKNLFDIPTLKTAHLSEFLAQMGTH